MSESRLASSYNSLPGSLESPRGLAAAATGLQGAAGVAGVAASTSSERSDLRAAATEFRPRGASNASGGAASPKLHGASPAFATAAAAAAAAPQPAKAQKQHQEPWQQLDAAGTLPANLLSSAAESGGAVGGAYQHQKAGHGEGGGQQLSADDYQAAVQAGVEMLCAEYASLSREAVHECYVRCGYDLDTACLELDVMEEEATAAPPTMDEANFPTLGGGRGGHDGSGSGGLFSPSPYAKVATQAAHLPAPVAAERQRVAPERRLAAPREPRAKGDALRGENGITAAGAWLETGQAVSNLYSEARAEASDHARLRNQYFAQAAAAHNAGDGNAARALSKKGRWHNEQMHAAHAQAADTIQQTRAHDAGKHNMLDLHGLHVAEAVRAVRRAVQSARARKGAAGGEPQSLRVVVGTGHHSHGGRARLAQAVESELGAQGITNITRPAAGLLSVWV